MKTQTVRILDVVFIGPLMIWGGNRLRQDHPLRGLVLAALGAALGVLWVKATFPALVCWTLRLHLPWSEAAAVATSAVAVCLLASWLPARRAARLDPAAALRME